MLSDGEMDRYFTIDIIRLSQLYQRRYRINPGRNGILRLPDQFLDPRSKNKILKEEFLENLHKYMRTLSPTETFIHNQLTSTPTVFFRNNAMNQPLEVSYEGPYQSDKRNEKYFKINVNGRPVNVSIEWLKPSYIPCQPIQTGTIAQLYTTCSRRKIGFKINQRRD